MKSFNLRFLNWDTLKLKKYIKKAKIKKNNKFVKNKMQLKKRKRNTLNSILKCIDAPLYLILVYI